MFYKIFWVFRALFYKPFLGSIGSMCYLGKPVYLGNLKRIYIGNKVRIFPGARIEVTDNNSSIHFEDNLSIGQNFHITSGDKLIIQKNTTIAENVMITNIDHEYQQLDIHILLQPHHIKKTHIGSNCFIGYGAVIQAGTILGKQCVIGANAVVRGIFPDYCVIVGVPARIVRRFDKTSKTWRRTNSKGEFIDE